MDDNALGPHVGDELELELQGDALHDSSVSDAASGAGSRFSLGSSRASPSPRASLRSQQSVVSSSALTRRRGRSDATHVKQPGSRATVGSAPSPAESRTSSMGLATPTRSTRSASTAPPPVDPRGDQELLQLMEVDVETASEWATLDLSLASKKTKKTLKSLQSLAAFTNLAELNVANNTVASLEVVDAFSELTALCVSRNHVKRIDNALFSLVNLRSLDLSGNFISHVPRGFVALEVLEVLNLSGNNLGALKEIDVLAKLANLHTCNFAANPFCKLPTYKDYTVSKLLSLELLDDAPVSALMRDKSRRRFSEEMFSRDKCLRDAGLAHASEQSKLLEMQLALEAENVKLKDELQLKSKLLQNKSKAWSSATEQLLQLQHDLAMMNLDRRHGGTVVATRDHHSVNKEEQDEDEVLEGDACSNQPEHDPPLPCDTRFVGRTASNFSQHRSLPSSPRKFNHAAQSLGCKIVSHEHTDAGTVPVRGGLHLDIRSGALSSLRANGSHVDAACSPFLERTTHIDTTTCEISDPESRSPQRKTSPTKIRQDSALLNLGMMSPHDHTNRTHQEITLDENDAEECCNSQPERRPSLRFPTFEDDSGCPAYDDPAMSPCRLQEQGTLAMYHSSRSTSQNDTSVVRSPRANRLWEQQRAQLARAFASGSPPISPRRSQVVGLVEKENLVRQIQALQSCKQSFLSEIANEEQLLHELKRESAGYANQIEHLEDDMQILIGSGVRGSSSSAASAQREEETMRAKLEVLRSKLHYAEDKECEIEATIVRMTKRVLEDDIQYSKDYGRTTTSTRAGCGPFDKEVFALTHNLQMVIVEKEEIHSEMSQLMNQLRKGPSDSNSSQRTTGLSAEALLLIDQHEQVQRVSAENQTVFIEKQKKADELKRKLRDVHDRTKIKENLIASLVGELKDVESELIYISDLVPKYLSGHRRALSLDSLPSSTSDMGDVNPHWSPRVMITSGFGDWSSRKSSSSPTKKLQSDRADASASISSMVEAAAADMNSQFEEKFKELFSPEVLDDIKRDIFDKLARHLPKSSTPSVSKGGNDQRELHAAIAAALEIHMKKAVQSFEQQRDGESQKKETSSGPLPGSSRELGMKADATASADTSQHELATENSNQQESDRQCWDQVDDFMPVPEVSYASKYRYVKETDTKPSSPSINSKCPRTASAQRIRRACERLAEAEAECKLDTFSGIEIDLSGKKKSDLKVLVMGARDLPTSHLRTKNLDPYVALEIVYPDYILPQTSASTLRPSGPSTLAQGRKVFVHESGQLPNRSFRSRTVKQSLYPVWDEEFDFAPVHSLKGFLHVRVLNDRKMSREQLVGEVKIPLRTLANQKKLVETFVLRTSTSAYDYTSSRKASTSSARGVGSSSGTIRVQLQLTYSRLERSKRAVDELVTKFLNDFNRLPDFVERIDYEARLAALSIEQNPEVDSAEGDGSSSGAGSPLPSFESWKAQHAPVDGGGDSQDGQTELPDQRRVPTACSSVDTMIGTVQQHSGSLSASIRAALWSTPAPQGDGSAEMNTRSKTTHQKVGEESACDPKKLTSKSVRGSLPSSQGNAKPNASASARAAMAQLRQTVNANTATQAATSLHNAGTRFSILHNSSGNRRKTLATGAPMPSTSVSPDCFDDYSPYHPDFQLMDPLGVDTLSYGGGNGGLHHSYAKGRSTSYTAGLSMRRGGHDRRTDLRIFKSPGFSRREPSGGFPERFIGLDSQTSERMKRIFGRIDSQG